MAAVAPIEKSMGVFEVACIAEAVARGAAEGGGSRQVVAAAISACLRVLLAMGGGSAAQGRPTTHPIGCGPWHRGPRDAISRASGYPLSKGVRAHGNGAVFVMRLPADGYAALSLIVRALKQARASARRRLVANGRPAARPPGAGDLGYAQPPRREAFTFQKPSPLPTAISDHV